MTHARAMSTLTKRSTVPSISRAPASKRRMDLAMLSGWPLKPRRRPNSSCVRPRASRAALRSAGVIGRLFLFRKIGRQHLILGDSVGYFGRDLSLSQIPALKAALAIERQGYLIGVSMVVGRDPDLRGRARLREVTGIALVALIGQEASGLQGNRGPSCHPCRRFISLGSFGHDLNIGPMALWHNPLSAQSYCVVLQDGRVR